MASPFDALFNSGSGPMMGSMPQQDQGTMLAFLQMLGAMGVEQNAAQPTPLQAGLMQPQASPFMLPPQQQQQVPTPRPDPRGRIAAPIPQGEPGLSPESFDHRFPEAGEINSGADAMRDPRGTARKLRESVTNPQPVEMAGEPKMQPINYLWNTGDLPVKRGNNTPDVRYRDGLYDEGKRMLKEKLGIDTPYPHEKFDDGPTLEQKRRQWDLRHDNPDVRDFKGYEKDMERRTFNDEALKEGKHDDNFEFHYKERLDKDPNFRAKAQKINYEVMERGNPDLSREVDDSPVLRAMKAKALMHLAGDVVPLPIEPGPNAGRPTGAEVFEGQRQIRGGSDKVINHPSRDQYSPRVRSRLMSDATEDNVKPGQQYAAANSPNNTTVSGGGNIKYVLRPDGIWMQHDNFGPVGPMPKGWSPPPVRAPGK